MLSAYDRWCSGEVTKGVEFVVIKTVGVMANQSEGGRRGVIEQGYFVLKKGADPPGVTRSVPLGVWGAVGFSSMGSGKSTCAVGQS